MTRAWRAIHWPELEERAAGVADRWDLMPGDDRYETGSLFVSGMAGGCSVVWLPPERTTTGAPMLSRNFGFPSGPCISSWAGRPCPATNRFAPGRTYWRRGRPPGTRRSRSPRPSRPGWPLRHYDPTASIGYDRWWRTKSSATLSHDQPSTPGRAGHTGSNEIDSRPCSCWSENPTIRNWVG